MKLHRIWKYSNNTFYHLDERRFLKKRDITQLGGRVRVLDHDSWANITRKVFMIPLRSYDQKPKVFELTYEDNVPRFITEDAQVWTPVKVLNYTGKVRIIKAGIDVTEIMIGELIRKELAKDPEILEVIATEKQLPVQLTAVPPAKPKRKCQVCSMEMTDNYFFHSDCNPESGTNY